LLNERNNDKEYPKMNTKNLAPVLIAGTWRTATAVGSFQAENPATAEVLPEQ
jgi:hypothetical protein